MAKVRVLIEVEHEEPEAFAASAGDAASEADAFRRGEALVADLADFGLEVLDDIAPVPMFAPEVVEGDDDDDGFAAFAAEAPSADAPSQTYVVSCEVDRSRLDELEDRSGVTVWPNSELTLLQPHLFDLARSNGGLDCKPFRDPVTIETVRELLGVETVWRQGFRGQNVIVGIIDEGVDGQTYPVVGGFAREGSKRPGTAATTSHGSMCAADVLIAAPAARLYDYPFLGIPSSGGALAMFQAVLDQRRQDGTPHLTNSSYGYVAVPPKAQNPRHEVHDFDHPVHRKVRESVGSGAPALFAAGNCGEQCPHGLCQRTGIGPGKSIHASNSLLDVITVAAVNSRHERIGYSSQGPGMFDEQKPDVACYSHILANFGPDRPGGLHQPYDSGTSAATPVVAGVAAVLLSAFPELTPDQLKDTLVASAASIGGPGWDRDLGHGVINAAAAFALLRV